MCSGFSIRTFALVVAVGALSAACGDGGSSPAADAAVPPDRSLPADTGGGPDAAVTDGALDAPSPDVESPDARPADSAAVDAPPAGWPPAGPFHTGKQCTLPACDPSGTETTDLSGTWTQTITTVSHTCNALAEMVDPRMKSGHVETLDDLTVVRAGECIYKDTVGGAVIGVIKGTVLVTCEVQPVTSGVTPVVESVVTFTSGVGAGAGTTYLFDVPVPPANCEIKATTTLTRK